MNVVNYEKLKEILRELWNRIKDKFIEDVTFDDSIDVVTNKPKNTLKKTKNGQPEDVIDHVVTEWKDLEYTTQSSLKNVFDKNTQVEDNKRYYYDRIQENQDWKIARIPCQAGDEFTIIKSDRNDSSQIGLFEASGVHIQSTSATYKLVKGRVVYHLTIPSSVNNVSYFVVSMEKNITNTDEVMVFKENVANNNIPTNYVPFTDGATVLINSGEVALSFDGTGTNLSSSTIHSAIKELNGKIANAGSGTVTSVNNQNPDSQGNVTIGINNIPQLQNSLDNKVNTSEVRNEANKIPRLNNQGKLVDDIIPELAITRIVDVVDKADAVNKASSADIQEGDFVRLTNEQNKIYIHNGVVAGNFEDRFIEISLGDATVRTVNGEKPRPNGEVTVHGNQISAYDGVSAKSVQAHLTDLRTTVNNHATRIGTLERKKPTIHVGEIITTFKDYGNTYKINGVTYLYCGTAQSIANTQYPQLMEALGLVGVARTEIPVIQDQVIRYDLGLREARRKHYIVAKID